MAFELEPDAKGLFGLCLFNADTAGDEELQDEFGQFGDLISLHRSNNLVFIRYQEREEAERCLEACRNHPKFKVNPARKKNPGNNDQRRQSNFDRSPREETMDRSRDSNRSRHSQGAPEPVRKLIPINKEDEYEKNPPPKEMTKGVIIANLPKNMDQSQIYELCTKAKGPPLKVEMFHFKPPGYRRITYACVDVKSDEERNNITKGLNNIVINGCKLLVNPAEHYSSAIVKE